MADSRAHELAQRWRAVQLRIAAACEAADRDPAGITTIAVSKTRPAHDIRILRDLGVRDIGESRTAEAMAKHAELGDLDLTWHMIGQIQTNKAAQVVKFADVVHSVDRLAVVAALQRRAAAAGVTIDVLVQANIDPVAGEQGPDATGGAAGGRGGAPSLPVLLEAARQVEAADNLRLRGLMAVPHSGEDPRVAFARLARLQQALTAQVPTASWLSAGMSGDFEAAIGAGATHLRLGSVVFGERHSVR